MHLKPFIFNVDFSWGMATVEVLLGDTTIGYYNPGTKYEDTAIEETEIYIAKRLRNLLELEENNPNERGDDDSY